jgi:hypothetical protein
VTTTALAPAEFSQAMEEYYIEASDDARLVLAGLQEQSRSAEIYREYEHLFVPEQLQVLAAARDAAEDPAERESLRRLWFEAADAVASRDLAQPYQDLTNDRLAWRGTWDGEEISYNTILALCASEPDGDRRVALYELACDADASFHDRDLDLAVRSERIRSEVFGLDGEVAIATARSGIDLHRFCDQVTAVSDATRPAFHDRSGDMFEELLGEREERPSRGHAAYMRSLHQFDHIYTSERMLDVCTRTMAELGFPLDTIPTILSDLEDRDLKNPRACVVPTKVPEEVHLLVRPTGGISDYQAFLHEAGHALHFGLTSEQLPFSFRALSPDHALTEIYSYVVERISHAPAWHLRHFGLDRETAERVCAHTRFIDTKLFRRYVAKLRYELQFWKDPAAPGNAELYRTLLSDATEMTYNPKQYLVDIDPGLYAADYLRAWRTSEQVIGWLEREFGEEWFADSRTGDFLRELFVQGTRPTNEQISEQIGSSPDDFSDLTRQLSH